MDEEIAIIDSNTRIEKLKNFFIKKRKPLILFLSLIIIILITFFGFGEYKKKKQIKISDLYYNAIIEYSDQNKEKIAQDLIGIINKKDTTYSPLSLYFIIDKNLVSDKQEINDLFSTIINEVSLEKEIKNLIIYKKALFFADYVEENELLEILNPLIKTESVWSSHALYLLGEYYFSKNEKRKSKEFFNKIQSLKNVNQDIQKETQKRLNRDFSE
jgi:predicted negative regulator of RcsB-dependent stress response